MVLRLKTAIKNDVSGQMKVFEVSLRSFSAFPILNSLVSGKTLIIVGNRLKFGPCG